MRALAILAGSLLALSAAAEESTAPAPRTAQGEAVQGPELRRTAGAVQRAQAVFVDPQGRRIGTATLTQLANGVLIETEVEQLPPGEHAFHIHETGQCDPATGFKSAGGHFAPHGNPHGFAVEKGPHAGDMANQIVPADGKLRAEVFNPHVSLAAGDAKLLDADGAALVIHAKADDYRSQPAGDAGDRIACAVIRPAQASTDG